MRVKAKLYKPSDKQVKQNSFLVSKAQVSMMMEIFNGDYVPILASKRESMEIFFICLVNDCILTKSTMLALNHKQLIRYNYSTFRYELTKLGLRIMKRKMANGTKSGIVHAVFNEKSINKTIQLAARHASSMGFNKL